LHKKQLYIHSSNNAVAIFVYCRTPKQLYQVAPQRFAQQYIEKYVKAIVCIHERFGYGKYALVIRVE
jgi:hypothetical protein